MAKAKRTAEEVTLEESDAWDEMSLAELLDASEPVDALIADRRSPKKAISIRVDDELIGAAKQIARRLGVGYQTLFRIWLMEGLGRYYREQAGAKQRKKSTKRAA